VLNPVGGFKLVKADEGVVFHVFEAWSVHWSPLGGRQICI